MIRCCCCCTNTGDGGCCSRTTSQAGGGHGDRGCCRYYYGELSAYHSSPWEGVPFCMLFFLTPTRLSHNPTLARYAYRRTWDVPGSRYVCCLVSGVPVARADKAEPSTSSMSQLPHSSSAAVVVLVNRAARDAEGRFQPLILLFSSLQRTQRTITRTGNQNLY